MSNQPQAHVADERELPPLPHPEMPHGSRDYFSAAQMKAYGVLCAEPYSDLIRKLAFEYSAGGYNSEGLLSPKIADSKLRWIIADVQNWPRAASTQGGDVADGTRTVEQLRECVNQYKKGYSHGIAEGRAELTAGAPAASPTEAK